MVVLVHFCAYWLWCIHSTELPDRCTRSHI